MENINNSRNTLTVKNKNIKYDDYNKIEWINYFNDELIVESINNQINNSINQIEIFQTITGVIKIKILII